MSIRITSDAQKAIAALNEIEKFLARPRSVLEQFATYERQQHVRAFRGRYDPETGKAWAPLKPSTIANKKQKKQGGRSLVDFLFIQVGNSSIDIDYLGRIAAIQHFGARTRPHIIVPKNRQALYWAGARHPVKKVKHPGSVIPARPLVGVSDRDLDVLSGLVRDRIDAIWEK